MQRTVSLDGARMETVLGKMAGDMKSVATAAMVLIGDKLGLYQAMVDMGPVNSAELAERVGIGESSIREWLSSQADSGHVVYDGQRQRYRMTPQQADALSDEASPLSIASASEFLASYFEKTRAASRHSAGGRR